MVAITSGGDEEDVFEIVGRKKWEQLVMYQNHLFFYFFNFFGIADELKMRRHLKQNACVTAKTLRYRRLT